MYLHRRLSLFAAVVFAISACGSTAQTPAPSSTTSGAATVSPAATATASTGATSSGGSPNPADLAVYAQIESQVQALRGLSAASPVTPVLLDSQGVRDWLTRANAAQTDHQAMANQSTLFIHLGLLPPGSSLEQMELELEAGQVIGFYDTTSKGLYVLSESGGVGGMEKLTFSHEYTHALQDQNFGLDKLAIDAPDEGDRDLARTAVVEGDATMLMTQWATKYLSLVELMQIAGESLSGPSADQMAHAPRILSETLMFPYEDGQSFVHSIYDRGGWAAVNELYANPPDSTSQILHSDLYTGHVKPVAVTVPAAPASLSGWKLTMQDTLGELELRIWLEGASSEGVDAGAAAAVSAWAGDRVGLYEGPNGEWAVVLHTAWRTAAGRDAFSQAATRILTGLGRPYRMCGDSTHAEVAIASSEALVPEFIACDTTG
jgi:hypothetical protein